MTSIATLIAENEPVLSGNITDLERFYSLFWWSRRERMD
jgi:hypothetical protein